MLGTQAEVELRTRGIGIHGACHGKGAIDMAVARIGGKLALDAVAGATGTGHAVGALKTGSDVGAGHVAGIGVAALDNKTGHIAMELKAIIEAHRGKLAEVRDMNGSALAVKLDLDGTLRRLDYGALVADKLILGRVELFLKTKHVVPSSCV